MVNVVDYISLVLSEPQPSTFCRMESIRNVKDAIVKFIFDHKILSMFIGAGLISVVATVFYRTPFASLKTQEDKEEEQNRRK